MNDTKSILARVLAQQEAKKAAQAAENQQQGASTERANVVPLEEAQQKIQERRNHAPKPPESQQAKPLRVRPRQTIKAEGTDKAVKAETVLPPSEQQSTTKIPKRQPPFEKRCRRVTTYLENGVYDKVQQLYESGEIDRISNLVNTAVRLYLMKHYGYGSKE
ncbi:MULTISPECIES: hypothetical protein [Brevibacillus]|uniref:Uncharacterized protein n=1 Tax=Brevibacillus brevis TaxID=1393 RepID=A0ABY9SYZ0_BREBE|nr:MULTISPECIES: hypothetical protein [Brevibacillus]MBY0051954.1 hypothetical protein [Brevibacillus agri]WNC13029.1 hypothetical protein RGB73_20205 [Brevibacillus brevis]